MSESKQLSSGIVQPEKFSIKWKIERFFGDCQQVGYYHKSQVISIPYAGKITNWYVDVYPNGVIKRCEDYVSLFLNFESKDEIEATVDFRLSILSKQNKQPMIEGLGHVFTSPSSDWGNKMIVEKEFLKDSENGALINDTLTIFCEVTFHPERQNCGEYDEWIAKIENEFCNYEKLLENGNFHDITFNLQDKKINVHKAIISYRSPVFAAMFTHDMKENKQSEVAITDINYDVMKELFRFLYSGKVRNTEKIVCDLLIAADKYQVNELKALCEKTLYQKLTVDNAVEYLKLTEMYDTIHLRRLLIKFVATHQILMVATEKD